MTPDDLKALRLQADAVRFLSFDAIEYSWDDKGVRQEHVATVAYDDLPEGIRALLESVPRLADEVERLRMLVAAYEVRERMGVSP